MIGRPLGGVDDPRRPFAPDRVVAIILWIAFSVGITLTMRGMVAWLRWDAQQNPTQPSRGFFAEHGWFYAKNFTKAALAIWLIRGWSQGRRWAFVALGVLSFAWLMPALKGGWIFDLALFSLPVVYAVMRLTGSFGPKPVRGDEADPKVRLDQWITALYLVLGVFNVLREFASILNSWRAAQETGIIAIAPFLAKRWSTHLRWIIETAVNFWIFTGIFRSKRWALSLSWSLSLVYLYYPLHIGHSYLIVSNVFSLAYGLGRLLFWPAGGPPRPHDQGDLQGQPQP